MATKVPTQLIPSHEAASELDPSLGTLACYRNLGEGPPYYKQANRRVLYDRAEVIAWRESRKKLRRVETNTTGA